MSERPIVSKDGNPLGRDEIACNFADLHAPLDSSQANAAADRCLYCFDAPCIRACPTAMDVPTFIHQIRTKNTDGAAKTILEANIMGGTCARVCPTETLCEEACVRNTSEDSPVEIGALQRFALDHFMDGDNPHPFVRKAETGKTIGVVGAGPAGLACAHHLAREGHTVTVYEAMPKPGGLNEYGLAAYKMVDDFAVREVDFILDLGGITIEYGQALGEQVTLEDLKSKHDAVFIGIGLTDTNAPGLDGEDLDGVVDAVDFIADLRQAEHPADIELPDSILVIGGGNTAVDAAVQAKRLGVDTVTMAYRRGAEQMSATEWEQDLATINGVRVEYWSSPKAFNADADGCIESVTFDRVCVGEDGRLTPTGRTSTITADLVLMAIGQKLDDTGLADLKTERGKIVTDDTHRTSDYAIYAGGDCIRSGEDLTVQAVQDGKQAAAAIHAQLSRT